MINAFEKLQKFKELAKVIYPKILDNELRLMVDHITREKDGVRKELTEQERVIKDIIIRYNYSARTLRYWFRLTTFPRFLQEQIKSGELSIIQAIRVYRDYRIKTDKQKEGDILQAIRDYVKNLEKNEFIDVELENAKTKIY